MSIRGSLIDSSFPKVYLKLHSLQGEKENGT